MLLGLQTAGKSCQSAVSTDNAVAGRDDTKRIFGVGGANSARGVRATELIGNLTVGADFAVRNGQKSLPDTYLKISTDKIQRQRKYLSIPGKIFS